MSTSNQQKKSKLATSVVQTGNTSILEWQVFGFSQVGVHIAVTGQALDAFIIQGRWHDDASYETLFSAAADFTSPTGILVGASGDLTTLAAGATGWFSMDLKGLYEIKLLASSGHADGSTVSVYAGGS